MLAALTEFKAEAAVVAGGDWPLIDPEYCRQMLDLHLQQPEGMQMTFTQAPPGLAGIVVGRQLLEQFAQKQAGFGQPLSYNPARPQADPIGKDVCVQVPAAVRACARRFIYDTARSAAMIDGLAARYGAGLVDVGAAALAEAVMAMTAGDALEPAAALPQDITLEITTRRRVAGPILPQFHLSIQRPEMEVERACAIVEQLGQDDDTLLTLGGLGDPLLHDGFDQIIRRLAAGGGDGRGGGDGFARRTRDAGAAAGRGAGRGVDPAECGHGGGVSEGDGPARGCGGPVQGGDGKSAVASQHAEHAEAKPEEFTDRARGCPGWRRSW